MSLNLTDYMWRIGQHTPTRIRLFLHCATDQGAALREAMVGACLRVTQISRGLVVVHSPDQIWATLHAIKATLSKEQWDALVRYVQAHQAGRPWRRGSPQEWEERVGATKEVCERFGLEYSGVKQPDEH